MPTVMELTLEQTTGVSHESRYALEGLKNGKTKTSDIETAEYDESNTYVLERFNTTAGNPVKKILLKLNLSDHRSILTDLKAMKNGGGDFRYSDTTHLSKSVKVLKLKNFKKDATLKLFKNGMSMSVQKSQVHKMAKFIRWRRDCAWLMISRGSRSLCQIQVQGTSSIQEVNDHYNIFTRERQEYELKTKDKHRLLVLKFVNWSDLP
ncbi:hypothetical protein Tco_1207656 [Tanacetum coccineum]